MIKLLVDAPSGLQELIKIEPTGSYYDLSKVLWDERVDGNFPAQASEIGGLNRVAGRLVFSQSKFDAQKTTLDAAAAAKAAKEAKKQALKTKNVDTLNSVPELREVVRDLRDFVFGL